MAHESIRIIHDEHSALSAMLRSLGMMVERGPGDQAEDFFLCCGRTPFYIDEFPERLHHTKESDLLFPACGPAGARGHGDHCAAGKRPCSQ